MASLLVKARRLVLAADSNAGAPTYLQGRVARGQPLPRLVLVAVIGGHNEGEEEASKLCSMVGFILGIGIEGMPESKSLSASVFRTVMGLVMPSWDPLRKGVGVLG